MADLNLKWKIEGEAQLSRRLKGLGNRVKDFKPEFKEATSFLSGFFSTDVFDSKGKAIGESWPRRKQSRPWPLLNKSGRMKRSFRTKVGRFEGTVFNATDYFKYHQSKEPRRKLPRRVMMKLSNQLKDKVIGIFHEGVWKRTRKKR